MIITEHENGSTIEEGVTEITLGEGEIALIVRPDLSHRLIMPVLDRDADVEQYILAVTAVAVLLQNNMDWVETAIDDVFGNVDDDGDDEEDIPLGPNTKGSA